MLSPADVPLELHSFFYLQQRRDDHLNISLPDKGISESRLQKFMRFSFPRSRTQVRESTIPRPILTEMGAVCRSTFSDT